MSDFNEQNEMWVDECDFSAPADEMSFIVDEEPTTVVLQEIKEPEMIIVEDDVMPEKSDKDLVPGSDIVVIEDEVDDAPKETSWADDKDHSKFVVHMKEQLNKIPRHSGETIPGCERAKAYLRSLDNEISQAMRSDLGGKIDEHQIDKIRADIEDMCERLDRQIKKLKGGKKRADLNVKLFSEGKCEKCGSNAPMWHDLENNKFVCMHCEAEEEGGRGLEKVANTPELRVYVSAFERSIVGILINSSVSAGRNIEETYNKLKNKYSFTPREELAIQQLVSDYGYCVFKDRGLLNEKSDPASGDGIDYMTNYYA